MQKSDKTTDKLLMLGLYFTGERDYTAVVEKILASPPTFLWGSTRNMQIILVKLLPSCQITHQPDTAGVASKTMPMKSGHVAPSSSQNYRIMPSNVSLLPAQKT